MKITKTDGPPKDLLYFDEEMDLSKKDVEDVAEIFKTPLTGAPVRGVLKISATSSTSFFDKSISSSKYNKSFGGPSVFVIFISLILELNIT